MAARIRLKRMGRRNRPFYRIGVFDGRTPRDGKTIELLGTYDPLNPNVDRQIAINAERAVYWLQQGAQPTDTVASFLKKLQITKHGAPDEPVKLSDVVKAAAKPVAAPQTEPAAPAPEAEAPAPETKPEAPAPEAEAPAPKTEPEAPAPAEPEAPDQAAPEAPDSAEGEQTEEAPPAHDASPQ